MCIATPKRALRVGVHRAVFLRHNADVLASCHLDHCMGCTGSVTAIGTSLEIAKRHVIFADSDSEVGTSLQRPHRGSGNEEISSGDWSCKDSGLSFVSPSNIR